MKRKLLSLAVTLVLCLGLTATPALAAAKPYTDDWSTKFSDVLDKVTETFVGYTGRKESQTIYYLAPEATVRLGKYVEKLAYLQIKRDEISMLDDTRTIKSSQTEKTYTRDEFEKEFGTYDLYCLVTQPPRKDGKTPDPEYLYFLFDDSAASNTANYVLNGTTLEKYRGSGGAMTIPDGVVKIQGMFMDASTAAEVTSLALPASVREIESWSFSNCSELSTVTLPSSLRTLGDCAFSSCTRLSNVIIPGSLTEIGNAVFADCGLTRVTFQSGLKEIGTSMFSGCQKLMAVTIPSSVTRIGERAFAGCTMLNNVVIENGNAEIGADAFPLNNNLLGLVQQSNKLTISAPSGGSVEAYCSSHNISFRSTGSVPGATTTPSEPAAPASATPTNDSLTVNGTSAAPTVFKINDNNYFKLRDVAALLNGTGKQFAVGYEGGVVTITTGQGYTKQDTDLLGAAAGGSREALPSNDAIAINGQKTALTVYKIEGNNYFKLRDLGKALNFYVGWSGDRGIYIETDRSYTE